MSYDLETTWTNFIFRFKKVKTKDLDFDSSVDLSSEHVGADGISGNIFLHTKFLKRLTKVDRARE